MPDLLIELFSEEIPARMQSRAADDLKRLMTEGLVEAGLTYESAAAFATPRRLALTVQGLPDKSPASVEERKGPRADAPEKALEGFLRSTGLSKDDLEIRDDKKGQVYFATLRKDGRDAPEIIAEVLESTIRNFPWPKSMRWGAGALRWVRPLHSILAILSDEAGASVVPFEIEGITASDISFGHRFMAPDPIKVTAFDDYEGKLAAAHVTLRTDARADAIWHDAEQLTFAKGLELVEDAALLREVAGLVECPVVLLGDIGADYLDMPPEVLQTSMREHQKFFSVRNPKTGRIEHYITVANRETADNGATILAGNSKVLAARLADAKFFWENDLRVAKDGMAPWREALGTVTFHRKLGSEADRVARISQLSSELAPMVGADAELAQQAAEFAKADLTSEMVYEFPELQGVMGKYYARHAGLPDVVAEASETHRAPLGPSDDVPTEPTAIAVALAEKIDMLSGFWAIDEKPTGSKDPFALRRAALGIIRIVLENDIRIALNEADGPFAKARDLIGKKQNDDGEAFADTNDVMSFIHDRLKVYLRDQGIRHDVIDACLAMPGADDLVLLVNRAKALQSLLSSDDGENLVQAFKRTNNILDAEEKKDGVSYELDPDPKLATNDSETALFAALDTASPSINGAMKAEDFAAAMSAMAKLRGPLDAFFEATKINDDNAIIRRNRLCILNRIRVMFGGVANFTKVEG